jgi:hypothetical protein
MMAGTIETRPSQWRWDRFDAKKVTSIEWARRNCVGHDNDTHSAHQAMQRRVLQDEKAASRIIAGELHQLLHDAADITGMTYRCKLTCHTLACINSKDIRLSWRQDGSAENRQRLAWMFYYYGTEIHRLGRSTLTHGEWVERKVMTALNIEYVHLADLPIGQRTCLQQLYSKKFNALRTNVMRIGNSFRHASMIKKEQPKEAGWYNKNYKRPKATFFMSVGDQESAGWQKVSCTCVGIWKNDT